MLGQSTCEKKGLDGVSRRERTSWTLRNNAKRFHVTLPGYGYAQASRSLQLVVCKGKFLPEKSCIEVHENPNFFKIT